MNREITPEIIESICALYWGQCVVSSDTNHMYPHPVHEYIKEVNSCEGWYLELTSLDNLSNEDSAFLVKTIYPHWVPDIDDVINEEGIQIAKHLSGLESPIKRFFHGENVVYAIDFLRQKGYALPAFGFSVSQLVAAGVYKLL